MKQLTTILATTIALGVGASAIGGCSGSEGPEARTPPLREQFTRDYAKVEVPGTRYYLKADSAGNIQYVRDDPYGMGNALIAWVASGFNKTDVTRNTIYKWEMPGYLADAAKAVIKANNDLAFALAQANYDRITKEEFEQTRKNYEAAKANLRVPVDTDSSRTEK